MIKALQLDRAQDKEAAGRILWPWSWEREASYLQTSRTAACIP